MFQKIFLLFFSCITVISAFAQDLIILKNGDEIQAIVHEIGIDDVKYKKFDNQDGPYYILKKSDVSTIRYENGNQDVFSEVPTPIPTGEQQRTIGNQQMNPYNSSSYSQQQLPVLKYTFGKPINPNGPGKSPFLASLLSFLIPGVGQFYNGDIGSGCLFMGANIVCNYLWMAAITPTNPLRGREISDNTVFAVGVVGALVVNITSIINASIIAKRINTARGYRISENTYLQIQPTIMPQYTLFASTAYTYGMSFRLNF